MSTEDAVPGCAVCEMRVNGPDGSVVYADELWTVTVGADVPGWFMVIANRHGDEWLWGLSDKEAAALGPLMRDIAVAAKAEAAPQRVYLMGFGEQWEHFHFLLMSRSAATPMEFRGPNLLNHAAELADRDEALRVGERVRSRLA
jgi:diadenosine tetraphosphate (Ap4A) HIT family hydrolase